MPIKRAGAMKDGFFGARRSGSARRRGVAKIMADAGVAPAGLDARQCMIAVWLVITAVWLIFWGAITAVLFVTFGIRAEEVGSLSLVVLAPPVALLAVGVVCRFICEAALEGGAGKPGRQAGRRYQADLPGGDIVLREAIVAQSRSILVVERRGGSGS
jgi:hypothetical protein